MKALKTVLWTIIILAAIILIGGLFLPKQLDVKKSVVIEKPTDIVYQQVIDFRLWPNWSPWHDSLMVYNYEETEEGPVTAYSWDHEKMGAGEMKVISTTENKEIKNKIQFERGSSGKTTWKFEETEEGTKVSWAMQSELSYPVERWMFFLFAKKKLEKSFDKGLKNLKAYTEAIQAEEMPEVEIVEINIEGSQPVIAYRDSAMMNEMEQKIGKAMEMLYSYTGKHKIMIADAPRIRWHSFNPEGYSTFETVLVLTETHPGNDMIRPDNTYEGKAIMATHIGPYEKSQAAWHALEKYYNENNLEMNGAPFEVYVNSPKEVDESELITQIYFPVK